MTKLIPLRDVVHNPHTALTVGTFDGVHAGHKVLINRVLTLAEQNDCKSVIVTFDPHPREIINPGPDGIKLLSTLEERRDRKSTRLNSSHVATSYAAPCFKQTHIKRSTAHAPSS